MKSNCRPLVYLSLGICLCCEPLFAQNLLALYEGDVANATDESILLDSSGNENHGIFVGSSGLVDEGVTGGALNFNNTASSHVLVNTPATGAFAGITDNQQFTIGYWASGGDTNPRNSSTFWANAPDQANTRAIQVHGTWGNGDIFLDVGGCCGVDTRLSGTLEEQFIRGSEGEEWTHFAFSVNDFGDALIYVNGEVYENQDTGFLAERFGPTAEILDITQFNIASNQNGANQWEGRMDDFFVVDEALSEDDIQQIFDSGIRSVFTELEDEPGPYVPQSNVELRLENLDGTLGLAAFVGSGSEEISSWRVEEIFSTSAGGQEITVAADLGQIGVTGAGGIGDADMAVAFGDVSLANDGADDLVRTFRLVADITNGSDPIIGTEFSTSMTAEITIPGSGGAIPEGVLQGDLNQNGIVDFPDFLVLSTNFGAAVGASESVPEPAGVALLGVAGLFAGLMRRRRS